MTRETPPAAYDRGVLDGRILTRLDKHAQQIDALEGLSAQQIAISATLTSTVQTLTEARVTDAATRVATAQAVKEANDTREAQAKSGWSPLAKFLAIAGSVVGVIGVGIALWALFI